MAVNLIKDDEWVSESCTLPTVEQPLRRAEFDELFAEDAVRVAQQSPQQIRIELRADPPAAARAAALAVKETGCCSFFSFDLAITDGRVVLTVSTARAHEAVLAALGARAESRLVAGA